MNFRWSPFSLIAALLLLSNVGLTACKSYCPGVDGTGNSASRGTRRTFGRTDCPAVAGTGNYKPKLKNKREDGLTSAKMERQLSKAAHKNSSPVEKKKLHFD
jgi:hypothetical protein